MLLKCLDTIISKRWQSVVVFGFESHWHCKIKAIIIATFPAFACGERPQGCSGLRAMICRDVRFCQTVFAWRTRLLLSNMYD